jgi:hypothetical protein
MPQCILQAFSLCVLYTNRTSENRGLVLRVLHESVKNLVHSAVGAGLTSQERIARVHALMIYQFVRMFDGDVTLATQVDSEMALLASWLVELANVGDNLDEEARMDYTELRITPPESWEASCVSTQKGNKSVCILTRKALGICRDSQANARLWERADALLESPQAAPEIR